MPQSSGSDVTLERHPRRYGLVTRLDGLARKSHPVEYSGVGTKWCRGVEVIVQALRSRLLSWRRPLSKGVYAIFRPPDQHSLSSISVNRTSDCDREPVGTFCLGPTLPTAVVSGERGLVPLAWMPNPQPGRSRVQGRPLAEREAETGGGADDNETTAWPTTTVAAPCSDP